MTHAIRITRTKLYAYSSLAFLLLLTVFGSGARAQSTLTASMSAARVASARTSRMPSD